MVDMSDFDTGNKEKRDGMVVMTDSWWICPFCKSEEDVRSCHAAFVICTNCNCEFVVKPPKAWWQTNF